VRSPVFPWCSKTVLLELWRDYGGKGEVRRLIIRIYMSGWGDFVGLEALTKRKHRVSAQTVSTSAHLGLKWEKLVRHGDPHGSGRQRWSFQARRISIGVNGFFATQPTRSVLLGNVAPAYGRKGILLDVSASARFTVL